MALVAKPEITIGMACHDDYYGVYMTIDAIRLYHPEVAAVAEFLVIDNHPTVEAKDPKTGRAVQKPSPHGLKTRAFVEGKRIGRYVAFDGTEGTAAPRDAVFRLARAPVVLCCDSHMMFAPGSLARLLRFFQADRTCLDLVQGPLMLDSMKDIYSHFGETWRHHMYGVWASDDRAMNRDGLPFEIPMQGLFSFACRKEAWLGFNPAFRGFGGEEGYIHEKFRRLGRRCLCLPSFIGKHRFERTIGATYPNRTIDRFRNYLIGWRELGLPLRPIFEHFMVQEKAPKSPKPLTLAQIQPVLDELGIELPAGPVDVAAVDRQTQHPAPAAAGKSVPRAPIIVSAPTSGKKSCGPCRAKKEKKRIALEPVNVS